MKQNAEIRKEITETLRREEQMKKTDMIESVYTGLSVTVKEICAEWSQMKREDLVYCVNDMPGWVGIYDQEPAQESARDHIMQRFTRVD